MTRIGIFVVLLLGVIITTEMEIDGLVTFHPITAQTPPTSSGNMNMTTPMMESASFHLKAAYRLLMEGNTDAALNQINLAQI